MSKEQLEKLKKPIPYAEYVKNNKLFGYIEYYEDSISAAVIAKKLAEFKYPHIYTAADFLNSHHRQTAATDMYEENLEERGWGIVSIDIPDFEERLATATEAYDLVFGDHPEETEEERSAKAHALMAADREKYRGKKESDDE